MSWSPHTIEFVRSQWMAGKSAGEIAQMLSRDHGIRKTRNAVIGKLHRMGVSSDGRATPPKPQTYRPAKKPRVLRAPSVPRQINRPPHPGPQGRPALVHGMAKGVDFKSTPEEAEVKRAAFRKDGLSINAFVISGAGVESPNARPILEHKTGCRWPIGERGDVRLCCNPISRGGYCEGHAAVAFLPGERKVGTSRARYGCPSVIEAHALWLTRFDRVDHYEAKAPRAKPIRTVWDEGRAA